MATDEAWANSVNHYDEDQLAALVSLIALINAYNRMKSSFSGRSSFDNASAVDLPVGGSHGITPCSAAIASFSPPHSRSITECPATRRDWMAVTETVAPQDGVGTSCRS